MFIDGSIQFLLQIAALSGRVAALSALISGTNYYGIVNDIVTSSQDYLTITAAVGSSFDYGVLF